MPTSPKFGNVFAIYGRSKFAGVENPSKKSYPNGNITIAGKVSINYDRVGEGGKDKLKSMKVCWICKKPGLVIKRHKKVCERSSFLSVRALSKDRLYRKVKNDKLFIRLKGRFKFSKNLSHWTIGPEKICGKKLKYSKTSSGRSCQ